MFVFVSNMRYKKRKGKKNSRRKQLFKSCPLSRLNNTCSHLKWEDEHLQKSYYKTSNYIFLYTHTIQIIHKIECLKITQTLLCCILLIKLLIQSQTSSACREGCQHFTRRPLSLRGAHPRASLGMRGGKRTWMYLFFHTPPLSSCSTLVSPPSAARGQEQKSLCV